MTRRFGMVVLAALLSMSGAMAGQASKPVVQVFKSATCGCCTLWVQHLEQNGFETRVTETEELVRIKAEHEVPRRVQSCHTAVVDGYVIEGHVPAADVHRLLRERPAVRGLAVPGMPIGSPGMEFGTTVQRYDVLTFDAQGRTGVFASH